MNNIFFKLHFAVFLAGFTGVFGRLISYDAFITTFFRFALASCIIYLYVKFTHKLVPISFRKMIKCMIAGAALTLHIIFFYMSIKLSNISIGTITIACTCFFTAILEPFVFREVKFSVLNCIFCSLTLVGVLMMFNLDIQYRLGIEIGIVSAFFSAVFALLNKKFTYGVPPYAALNYEMLGAFVLALLLCPIYFMVNPNPNLEFNILDSFYLFLLASIFTVGLYLMWVKLIPHLSAFTVSLTLNLEPVYSVLIAMIIYSEHKELNCSFYIGTLFIVCSIILQNMKMARNIKSTK